MTELQLTLSPEQSADNQFIKKQMIFQNSK